MTSFLDNEYQDSRALGSLVSALGMWRGLLAANQHADPQQLSFAYACPSKIVARDLAGFLRESESWAAAAVGPRRGALPLDEWQVEGITLRAVQSLRDLELTLTGLRLAGIGHGSRLVSLAI
jgi:hypothetical protein